MNALSQIGTADWFPLFNSLRIAALASVIVFFLGIGCARLVARLPRAVKGVLDVILTLPMVLPPTVCGYFLLMVVGIRRPLGALLDQAGIAYTVASVFTDEADIPEDSRILNRQSKQSVMDSFDTFMDLMNKMIWLLVAAAVVLGIVVLYNLGVMSYTERYREMATLKVVGFRDSKIGWLLISQNLWLTVIGIAVGIPAGIGVLGFLLTALASEYELKLSLGLPTWLVSILLTFGVSLIVGLMIARKNRHIDMVAALKTEE